MPKIRRSNLWETNKKNSNEPIQKNIGRIFRKHNIIEYKSPTYYLSIDDFYLVYGYACLYKADTTTIDHIPANEITLSFVCHTFPQKLVKHLKSVRKYTIEKQEAINIAVTAAIAEKDARIAELEALLREKGNA